MGQIGTGIDISFATGFFAEVLDVNQGGIKREAIDTSHMKTVKGKTFTPGDLIDWGELSIDFAFDPGEEPPIDGDPETCTITFRDGEKWAFTAFMTDLDWKGPLEDKMTASAKLKVSGDVTITDAT